MILTITTWSFLWYIVSIAYAAFALGILFTRWNYMAIIETQTAYIDEILDLNKSLIIEAETKGEELAILKDQIKRKEDNENRALFSFV